MTLLIVIVVVAVVLVASGGFVIVTGNRRRHSPPLARPASPALGAPPGRVGVAERHRCGRVRDFA